MAINNNSTINGTPESAAYTYDNLSRLVTSSQTSNGSTAQRRFAYDRWGNRTGMWDATSGGNQIQTIALQQSGSAPTNRITSVTGDSTLNYTYDAAGNVTNDGAHTYTYDAENRVVTVDGGATAQYRYDHQNRRYKKTVGSSVTHYIWQGSQVIAEHDGTTGYTSNPTYQASSARADYIYAGSLMISSRERASSGDAWTTKYYLSDRLSTRLALDISGSVVGRQAHLPFGEDFGESGTQEKHHFTSYERDAEIGLDYAVNRGYAWNLGRFSKADPYKASAYMVDPQSWKRYNYVRNNATNRVDQLGLADNEPPIVLTAWGTYPSNPSGADPLGDGRGRPGGFVNDDQAADPEGGDPQDTINRLVEAILQGINIAIEALSTRPDCMEMFTGPNRTNDPIQKLQDYFANGLIRASNTYPTTWDPASRSWLQSPFQNVNTGAITTMGGTLPLRGNPAGQSAFLITINL